MIGSHHRDWSIEANFSGCLGGGIDGTAKDFEEGPNISGLSSNLFGEKDERSLGEEFLCLLQMYRIIEQGFKPRHQDIQELFGRVRGEVKSLHTGDTLHIDLRRGGSEGMGVRN